MTNIEKWKTITDGKGIHWTKKIQAPDGSPEVLGNLSDDEIGYLEKHLTPSFLGAAVQLEILIRGLQRQK